MGQVQKNRHCFLFYLPNNYLPGILQNKYSLLHNLPQNISLVPLKSSGPQKGNLVRRVPAVVDGGFFHIGKQEEGPRHCFLVPPIATHRECPTGVVVILHCETNLLEIVLALAAPRGFAGGLDGGQQECDQDPDDRDHDKQLHERESTPAANAKFLQHNHPLVRCLLAAPDISMWPKRPPRGREKLRLRKFVDWSPLQTACRPNQEEHRIPVITQFATTFARERQRLREKSNFSQFFNFSQNLPSLSANSLIRQSGSMCLPRRRIPPCRVLFGELSAVGVKSRLR